MTRSIRLLLTVALSLLMGVAHQTWAGSPEIDTHPDTEPTIDGLYPVKQTRIDKAFAKPGLDLSAYSGVMVAPVSIAYRKNSFELTDKQTRRMNDYFWRALDDALVDNGYDVASEPATDVLLVVARIVDLDINVPTKPRAGRSTYFTASSGSMTLIGELRDSVSGEVLVRFADQQQPRSHWARSTSVDNWSDVRQAFKFWATILQDRLDYFHGSDTQ